MLHIGDVASEERECRSLSKNSVVVVPRHHFPGSQTNKSTFQSLATASRMNGDIATNHITTVTINHSLIVAWRLTHLSKEG